MNWIVDPAYKGGLLLIRGGQLDGAEWLRFGRGMRPPLALKLRVNRSHPSTTRLRTAGCYAYQVDGFGVSKLIIFEARQF